MAKQAKRNYPISRALKQLVNEATSAEEMTYRQVVDCLGAQGFGLIIVLFALPSALPLSAIPGFSFIFGLPIVFIALQMIVGSSSIWLPKFLAKRKVNKKKLTQVIKKTLPYLKYIEKLLKSRWYFFTLPTMERVHGCMLLLLSLLLLLPIPMSNFIFAGFIILFGLGLTAEDGICLVITYLGAIFYILFMTSLIKAVLN